MRRILILSVIMVMAAAPAFSQPFVPKFEFGAGAGLTVPTGAIGDGMNNGYAINANAGYRMMPMLTLGAEFGYYGNAATDETLALTGASGMDMTVLQFTGMAKVNAPVMVVHNVYAKGLAGAYNVKSSIQDVPLFGSLDVSDTRFGAGVGAGFQFNAGPKTAFYVESVFHNVFGETEDFRFFTAGAGVIMTLP